MTEFPPSLIYQWLAKGRAMGGPPQVFAELKFIDFQLVK